VKVELNQPLLVDTCGAHPLLTLERASGSGFNGFTEECEEECVFDRVWQHLLNGPWVAFNTCLSTGFLLLSCANTTSRVYLLLACVAHVPHRSLSWLASG